MIDLHRFRRLRDDFWTNQVLPLKREFEYRVERELEAEADLQRALEARRVARLFELPEDLANNVVDFHIARRRDEIPGPIPSSSREPWGAIAMIAWGAYWLGLVWAFATGRLP